ncbi:hypothetical protein AB0K16_22575 [Nonomuraea jabiensis]|uniref:hypothetical protein n=1 Tax=Nonomuraea jabiensis TaxID=882448 RepID=UPI0034125602
MTYIDAVELAENPAWQQARHPETGQPLYYDGTPVVYQVPMEQRMAPIVKHRMRLAQWVRNVGLTVGFFFALYIVVVVKAPELGDYLQHKLLPFLSLWAIWVISLLIAWRILWAIAVVIKDAFAGPPTK